MDVGKKTLLLNTGNKARGEENKNISAKEKKKHIKEEESDGQSHLERRLHVYGPERGTNF